MNLTDILGAETLAYENALKNESSGSGLFLGNWLKKPAAKNMYRNSAIARKVEKLIDRAILFFINIAVLI
jgi:hypothetical protein